MEIQIKRWICEDCNATGSVELPDPISAWDAMHTADLAHAEAAPDCSSYNIVPDSE